MTTSYGGFYAAAFPTTTLTNANTFYVINWDTMYPVNTNIIQNLPNNNITVLISGIYQINSILSFQPSASIGANFIEFSLFQNGNAVVNMQARDAGFGANYQTVSVSGIIQCAQNDVLDIRASVNSAGYSINMLSGANFTVNLIKYILD